MLRKEFLTFICLLLPLLTIAQQPNFSLFPDERAFPLLKADPLEAVSYSGLFVWSEKEAESDGLYIPVNFALSKPIIGLHFLGADFNLGLEGASYTQFEIIRYDSNTLRGGLLNTDFRGGGFLTGKLDKLAFRIRLFHISSHIGDDYMLRNQYFETNSKTVNYEQLDFTGLYQLKNIGVYLGAGQVISPNTYRKRFSFQTGYVYLKPLSNSAFALSSNLDIKCFAQNDFYPNTHFTFGIAALKEGKEQLTLNLDVYNGHLPYSTFEYRRVSWVGISIFTSLY